MSAPPAGTGGSEAERGQTTAAHYASRGASVVRPLQASLINDMTVLEAALQYALVLKWYVFPVRGKVPAVEKGQSWQKVATRDPHQIAAWYAGARSGLGVAVDLGQSNLVVIDGDNLEKLHEAIPAHLLADGIRLRGNPNRCSWLFAGRLPQARHEWGEVKSAGGYIVLPPSPHPHGTAYNWLDNA